MRVDGISPVVTLDHDHETYGLIGTHFYVVFFFFVTSLICNDQFFMYS